MKKRSALLWHRLLPGVTIALAIVGVSVTWWQGGSSLAGVVASLLVFFLVAQYWFAIEQSLPRNGMVMGKEVLQELLEKSPVPSLLVRVDGRAQFSNPAFLRLCELADDSRSAAQDCVSEIWSQIGIQTEAIQQVQKGMAWSGELDIDLGSAKSQRPTVHMHPLAGGGETDGLLALFIEFNAHALELQRELFQQSNYDQLTGLPNRALALDRLRQAMSSAARHSHSLALMQINIDQFRQFNETHGHQVGDELLRLSAKAISELLRDEDTLARQAGDEFLLILVNQPDDASCGAVAQKIKQAFRDPFLVENLEIYVTVSIGICVFPQDGETESDLLRHVDAAMSGAKDNGRNSACFYQPAMNDMAKKRLETESLLRFAADRGELELVYQPLIDARSGRVVSMEALVRWHSPELGPVSPEDFIPLAEENGMIVPIGEWIIDQACCQMACWRDFGFDDLTVAVNVSSRQFIGGSIVSVVERALHRHQLEGRFLKLEITEGLLLNNTWQTQNILQKFKGRGVVLSLDDFGTGYSSLSYLHRYPFDILKIDRSFVSDLDKDTSRPELLMAIINMAHGLNLEVVAEGVETELQANFLRSLSCDYLQGYLYSKPLSADQLTPWIIDRRLACDSGQKQVRH